MHQRMSSMLQRARFYFSQANSNHIAAFYRLQQLSVTSAFTLVNCSGDAPFINSNPHHQ